nr:DUF4062 domain-containing protein [Pantoea agglomerans]
MDKRYQVFVSSTYTDLVDERHSIMLTLMKMDCIPAGMEHFPAADEEQWNFIKRIIDYSDYYLLIIGGRYGSLDDDGLSFTEKEYNYAVEKNIKVVALIHGSPEKLTFQNSEQDPALREKLEAFRDRVKTKRLVEFWTNPSELPGKVALGIMNARTMHPATGWVRADRVSNEKSLIEINNLRKENNELLVRNNKLEQEIKLKESATPDMGELASFDSDFNFTITGFVDVRNSQSERRSYSTSLTWKEIFFHISPLITTHQNESNVNSSIADCAREKMVKSIRLPKVKEQDFLTIGIQLKAYGLVKIENLKTVKGTMALFWSLTPQGYQLMTKLRTIKN